MGVVRCSGQLGRRMSYRKPSLARMKPRQGSANQPRVPDHGHDRFELVGDAERIAPPAAVEILGCSKLVRLHKGRKDQTRFLETELKFAQAPRNDVASSVRENRLRQDEIE